MQVSLSVLINSDSADSRKNRQPQIPADPSVSHRYQGLKLNKSYLYSKKIKIPNVYSASTYAVRSSFTQIFFNQSYEQHGHHEQLNIKLILNMLPLSVTERCLFCVKIQNQNNRQSWHRYLLNLPFIRKHLFYALHFYSHFTGVSFLRLFQIKLKKSLRTISNRGSTSAFSQFSKLCKAPFSQPLISSETQIPKRYIHKCFGYF